MNKQSKNIKYSIVIPAYNEEAFIGNTLVSLSGVVKNEPVEIIVVDNNSTDETPQIAKAHGARVVKEMHPGVCWARQSGYEAAKGEIIISTDADTIFSPDWLQSIDRHFNRPEVVAVAGGITYVGEVWWANIWSSTLFGWSSLWQKLFGQPGYISACNLAFKKDAINGYDTSLTQGGDELDVLKQLNRSGTVLIDRSNAVFTSDRRQSRGLFYNLFVTLIWYYVIGYNISRFTRKNFLGGYPAFRDVRRNQSLILVTSLAAITLVITIIAFSLHLKEPRPIDAVEHVPRYIMVTLRKI